MLWCIHTFDFLGFSRFLGIPKTEDILYYTGALCNPGLSTFSGFLIFEFPPLCKVLIPPNGFGFYSLLPSSLLLIPSTPIFFLNHFVGRRVLHESSVNPPPPTNQAPPSRSIVFFFPSVLSRL